MLHKMLWKGFTELICIWVLEKNWSAQWKNVNFRAPVEYDPNKIWSFQKASWERASLPQGKWEKNGFQTLDCL